MNISVKVIMAVIVAVTCVACKPANKNPPQQAATASDYPATKSGPVTRLLELTNDRDNIQVREIISPSGVFCVLVNNNEKGVAMQCDFEGKHQPLLK